MTYLKSIALSALCIIAMLQAPSACAQKNSALRGVVQREQSKSNGDATFAEAVALYKSGDYNGARVCFWRLAQETPNDYRTQYYLANSFFQMKDFQNAQIWYDKCLSNHPDAETAQNCSKANTYLKKPAQTPVATAVTTSPVVALPARQQRQSLPPDFIKFQNEDQDTRSNVCYLVKFGLHSIPDSILTKLAGDGYSILITPTILESMPRMAASTPRGYGDDSTYDNAGALFRTELKQIVVAEKLQLKKNSPNYNPNDFAADAVRHELGHAIDCNDRYPSRRSEFKLAYDNDEKALSGFDRNRFAYFLQSGDAGRSELFAQLFSIKYCPEDSKTKQMTDLVKAFSHVSVLMKDY